MTFNQWWGGRNLGNNLPENRIAEVDERVCRRAWTARDAEVTELNRMIAEQKRQIDNLIEECGLINN